MENKIQKILTIKRIVFLLLLIVPSSFIISAQIFSPPISNDKVLQITGPMLSLVGADLKNATIALNYGIKGYIEAYASNGTSSKISIMPGKEKNITILIHFISHLSNFNETWINLDPSDESGLIVEQALGDGKGTIKINDFIKYEPSGRVFIKAGETLAIKIRIIVPEGISGVTMPLNLVGVTSEVPVFDYLEAKIIV